MADANKPSLTQADNEITEIVNYTNIPDIKQYWLDTIGPNYFDFNTVNNYNSGIFGMVLEILGEATEDSFNAMNIARREFYPVTAQYMSSLYKMATLQGIDIPMTTPAKTKALLVLSEDEIIENSSFENGIYTCVIDSVLKMMVNDLVFLLDYPIIILSKKTKTGWSHTIHYDISVSNSLNNQNEGRYISNKIIKNDGVNCVVLFLDTIRQLEMVSLSNILVKDSVLETTSLEIDYDGNLANFEVFYKESQDAPELQLTKVLLNGTIPDSNFCYYELVSNGKIRLTFPSNVGGFSPAFNSEIITRIYTSQGEDGNFDFFDGELICSSDSDQYPYNSTMSIVGKVNGSSTGGKNQLLGDEFRSKIVSAYSTNGTLTTEYDIQQYFDDLSDDISNVQVRFRKKRDDYGIRLFGSYVMMKDTNSDVIPSNTLDAHFPRSAIMSLESKQTRVMLKPGYIFEYANPTVATDFTVTLSKDQTLLKAKDSDGFRFINPFLIGINLDPNNVGYYLNSINETLSVEYTYVNDDTSTQFISNKLRIYRNAIEGSNYYKFSLTLGAASADTTPESLADIPDIKLEDNLIRAKDDGVITSEEYVNETGLGFVKTTVTYKDGTTATIQSSNILSGTGDLAVTQGYKMRYRVGESFTKNNILATKRPKPTGKLKVLADISNYLYTNQMYIPFILEDYVEDIQGFEFCAYLSTDDFVDTASQIVINHGIYNQDGTENDNIALPMSKLTLEMHAFYLDDNQNIDNKYSNYAYVKGYTLTNTYISAEDTPFDLVFPVTFVRGVVDFKPGTTTEDYVIHLSEVPFISAAWAKKSDHYTYFIDKLYAVYGRLELATRRLENNFALDMKFYNTYGRARFYSVGITSHLTSLDSVGTRWKFGVRLLSLSNTEAFLTKFRTFVKDYIENTDAVTAIGQDIYIFNLTKELLGNFSEIAYLEYYGFNDYDQSAQKIIGPDTTISDRTYIPEFVNVLTALDEDNLPYPDVAVRLLDS